ncbi:hypothetical protein [Streptomyces sp. NPDC055210]
MTDWGFEYTGHALSSVGDFPPEQRQHLDQIASRLAAEAAATYPNDPEYGDPGVSNLLNHPETPWLVSYQIHRSRRLVYIVQILDGPTS